MAETATFHGEVYGYFGDVPLVPPLESSIYFDTILSTRFHRLACEKMVPATAPMFYGNTDARIMQLLTQFSEVGCPETEAKPTGLSSERTARSRAQRIRRELLRRQRDSNGLGLKKEVGEASIPIMKDGAPDSATMGVALGLPPLLQSVPGGPPLARTTDSLDIPAAWGEVREIVMVDALSSRHVPAIVEKICSTYYGNRIGAIVADISRSGIQAVWERLLEFCLLRVGPRESDPTINQVEKELVIIIPNADLFYRNPECPRHASLMLSLLTLGIASILHHFAALLGPSDRDNLLSRIAIHVTYFAGDDDSKLAADGLHTYLESSLKLSVKRALGTSFGVVEGTCIGPGTCGAEVEWETLEVGYDCTDVSFHENLVNCVVDRVFDEYQRACDDLEEGMERKVERSPLFLIIVPSGSVTLRDEIAQKLRDCYCSTPIEPLVGHEGATTARKKFAMHTGAIWPVVLLLTPPEVVTEVFWCDRSGHFWTSCSLHCVVHCGVALAGEAVAASPPPQGAREYFIAEGTQYIASIVSHAKNLAPPLTESFTAIVVSSVQPRPTVRAAIPACDTSSRHFEAATVGFSADAAIFEVANVLLACSRRFADPRLSESAGRQAASVEERSIERQVSLSPGLLIDSRAVDCLSITVQFMRLQGLLRASDKKGGRSENSPTTFKLGILGRLLSYRFRFSSLTSLEAAPASHASSVTGDGISRDTPVTDLTTIDAKLLIWGHAFQIRKEMVMQWIQQNHLLDSSQQIQRAVNLFCAVNKLTFVSSANGSLSQWCRLVVLLACYPDIRTRNNIINSGPQHDADSVGALHGGPSRIDLFYASPTGYRCVVGRHDTRPQSGEIDSSGGGGSNGARCRGWYPQAPLHVDYDDEGVFAHSTNSTKAYCYPPLHELCEIHTTSIGDVCLQLPMDVSYPLIITHAVIHTAVHNNAVMLEWDSALWGGGAEMRPVPIPVNLLQSPTFRSLLTGSGTSSAGIWLDSVVDSKPPPQSDSMLLAPVVNQSNSFVGLCSIRALRRKRKASELLATEMRARKDGVFRGKEPRFEEERSLIEQVASAAAKLGRTRAEECFRGKRGFHFLDPADEYHPYYLHVLAKIAEAVVQ